MILLFVNNYRRRIAFTFLTIFSLQLCMPAIAADTSPVINRWEPTGKRKPAVVFARQPWRYNSLAELSSSSHTTELNRPVIALTNLNPDHHQPDIDGPGQPEMKSFQSVNSDNMVDLFTGDFSYNIPLLDVGGYPVNLHYTSGITMDQEASWVGLGWNVNPGSISRSMRGLPDDFDAVNDSLTKTQHVKDNRTTGVTLSPSLEIVGHPQDVSRVDLSATLGIFYNTYNGYGLETGVGIGGTGRTSFGSLTGDLSISNNSQEGIRISPSLSAKFGKSEEEDHLQGTLGISTGYSSRTGITSLQINGGVQKDHLDVAKSFHVSGNSYPLATINFAKPAYTPSVNMPIKNVAYSFTGKVGGEVWGTDASASFTGYVNTQSIADEDITQKIPAAGYLYATKANGRENVLMDFNREKDMQFNYKTTPHIAIPQYTYDAFSISGEGTGGSFRPYRGDVGYIFDHSIASRSSSTTGSVDVGFGATAHAGLEVTNITTNTTNHRWNQNNNMESRLAFTNSDTTYESVYFRNPGEKTINAQQYYRAIGDDSLIRIKLSGSKDHVFAESAFIKYNDEGRMDAELPVTGALVKKERDKRTQVISYLTAEDASIVGLDKMIRSYSVKDTFPGKDCEISYTETPRVGGIRKKNHLSEISVLNSDGRKYVYGLPIYNAIQKDVTFAVSASSSADSTGLTGYGETDNTPSNTQGKDGYFSKEEMPGYAHNFLLTGIVSPDYVDLTGNGISEDDPGDAVRFNYTEVYGQNGNYFRWRTPFQSGKANYNEGLKTYDQDNKASYLYGEKEMWYLHTIESKTMIAVFRVKNDRKDVYGVDGENGNLATGQSAYKLDSIQLYVKADIVRNGINAKPVKTVHFSYGYDLCKNAQGTTSVGKLTLKSIWFTYNKNNKGKLNPYVFQYHPDSNGDPLNDYNPSFNSRNSDRWGVYKSKWDNPDNMSNTDFPYSIQNADVAARNASMWNLTDIILPSGGKMHVTYESDDYGYVQNKRATQMTEIKGVNQYGDNKLYNDGTEFDKLYFNAPEALTSKADLRSKYLDIDEVVYFKLAVLIPKTTPGNPVEMIPGYGTLEDYGIDPTNNTRFWIKLAKVDGSSPLVRSALQYLRLNLPSKAYPNSQDIDHISTTTVIKMLATSFSEIKNMALGFDGSAQSRKWCQVIDLNRSFVRLSNPGFKKYGGGYRVKSVQIYDNWNKMTGKRESVYGQEYIYTTTEKVNGVDKTISSGVATYEPAIGGEENPFRQPLNYIEKVAPMAPVNFMFSEEPLGESFFPSPMIGYSKVRVRTINKKARSANGWAETEFYTSRDFPVLVEHTLLEEGSSKFKYETTSNILRLNHKNFVTLSQGFKIELNDMNGKMKAQSTYAETDSLHPIAYTLNFYKTDDDKALPKHLNNEVWAIDSTNATINTKAQIGKDIEVMTDLREQDSKANTIGFSPNVDIIAPFLPFIPVLVLPSKVNLPQKEETRYRAAAVTKIVQRYGILDSVVVMDKGSVVSTKNMVYDAGTGNVVLSRTNNEFNDPVYNFNYPAYWAYSGMGQAYKNISAIFQSNNSSLQLNGGILYKSGLERYPAERFFESGDEVYVSKARLATAGADCRYLGSASVGWSGRLWVINASKGVKGDTGFYFIDSLGKTARDMVIDKMAIIRSGKRNMSDVSAGNVVMLNSPVKQLIDGRYKIVIDSNTRVLNASAATFRDMWKVENSEYQEDSCYTLFKEGQVDTLNSSPSTIFRSFYKSKSGTVEYLSGLENSSYVASSLRAFVGSNHHEQYNLRSVIKFDLLSISQKPNVTVTGAVLNLHGQAPRTVWQGYDNDNRLSGFPEKTKAFYQYGPGLEDHPGRWSNASIIRRVTGDWAISTHYDLVYTTETGKATISAKDNETCSDPSVTVTSITSQIVSAMAADPATNHNHGFAIDLADWGTGDESNGSERTQSYCSALPVSVLKSGEALALPAPGECLNCTGATLYVTYSYYKDTCVKVCRKNISDTATNPYRWGILGNWRMERSYVYYNARTENDATVKQTDIRKEGTLKDFVPYWTFATERLLPSQDSSRWVWNSAIETFNRKGFEIENYDALGRYNAGLYGYNQTLPVAVAQNSRYRELLYDGFEDYGYSTNYCATCPPQREFDFVKGNSGVDTTRDQSHTGLYSVKVNSGSEGLLTVPVDTILSRPAKLHAQFDSSAVFNGTVVNGTGTGLSGAYLFTSKSLCLFNLPDDRTHTRIDAGIDFNWNTSPITLSSDECDKQYHITWTGTIQPRYTDRYTFYFDYNGTASVLINNVSIHETGLLHTGEVASNEISLVAGELYTIKIDYTRLNPIISNPSNFGHFTMRWKSLTAQAYEVVPATQLYPADKSTADTTGSVTHILNYWCVKGATVAKDTITKNDTLLRDRFSPVGGTTLTVSAWVRLDVEDCNATPALDSVIKTSFNTGGDASTFWLKKTGVRIEGWQRYEANVKVPADATSMYMRLKTLADVGIYVDDIRVQPFNSSMKGFVYNPVNLRLMAELDENNYASFYEYDDDGTLIRVKKETERGIMTIQETRSALFKE